ncbi:MAG: glycosyltransferase 87 family protein, partial [Thermoplasmatota archaeon]
MRPGLRNGLVVAAVAVAVLGGSFAWKNACTFHSWDDHWQYKHYCYSDILPLWFIRHLDTDQVPYVQEFSEYPVLTGLFMFGVAKATTTLQEYMVTTFVLLSVAAGSSVYAFWRIRPPLSRTLAWLILPSLALHFLVNWDILAVACTLWGWHEWRNRRPLSSALLFGLGGAAKLYPAFFLPFLFLDTLRRKDRDGTAGVAAGGPVTLTATLPQSVGGNQASVTTSVTAETVPTAPYGP